jgi:hypothetical protein
MCGLSHLTVLIKGAVLRFEVLLMRVVMERNVMIEVSVLGCEYPTVWCHNLT